MSETQPWLSFIIPHKGREEMLRRTVQSIARQGIDLQGIEVIVVSQNPSLAVGSIAPGDSLQLRVIHRPESETISHLRNIGVEHAAGAYFAFLDADIELSANWVAGMIEELQSRPGRALVSAVQRCTPDAPVLERIRTALSNAVVDSDVGFLPGRNLLLRRESFFAAGGFPEHLVTCEDYYFTDRVHQLGALYYSSRASYVHLGEDKRLDEMFRKEIWRGQSNLRSIGGRRIPLEELPSFLVPLWILLFAVLALVSISIGRWSLAATGAMLATMPILAYSWRLYRIANGTVGFMDVLRFYLVYFPARIVGTYVGVLRSAQGR